MYATITELACKDSASLEHIVENLKQLHAEVKTLPAFKGLHLIRTEERTLAMVTLYESAAAAEALSGQVRTHLGELIGQYVAAPPRRSAGEVLFLG